MCGDKRGLGIIFHSGSYDRVAHGLSIALAALALGREAKLFFSYWALEYLRRDKRPALKFDVEGEAHRKAIEHNLAKGHMLRIQDLFSQAKAMGAKFYACTNSMGILNIARDELTDEVDKAMGITTFLTETTGAQVIFV